MNLALLMGMIDYLTTTKKGMGTNKRKNKMKFNSIEEAIQNIKSGKIVIVVDDENRENEGDFVAAAEMVSPEMVNFMATHGRGFNLRSFS